MNSTPHPHRRHRHSRRGRLQVVMLALAALVFVGLIAGLFWLLTSSRFLISR